MMLPKPFEPVIALICDITELGSLKWTEVVYHDGEEWASYSGSHTFEDGEIVAAWNYASDIYFKHTLRPDLLNDL